MTDTLHGVPVPAEFELEAARRTQAAIEQVFGPVRQAWEARSQDMLDVLADSQLARAEVRRGVGTIRLAAMLGVLAMLAGGLAVWTTLERERAERRLHRQLEDRAREAAALELGRRLERACARNDGRGVGAGERSNGRPGAAVTP